MQLTLIPIGRKTTCRICGSVMQVDRVRYAARDGDGRQQIWEGVRHYHCPQGCPTGFYDFRKARRLGPEGKPIPRVSPEQAQALGWGLTAVYVVIGMVLMYALFLYGVAVIPGMGLLVRIGLGLLLTAAFVTAGFLMLGPSRTTPTRRPEPSIPAVTDIPAAAPSPAAPRAAAPSTAAATPEAATTPEAAATPGRRRPTAL